MMLFTLNRIAKPGSMPFVVLLAFMFVFNASASAQKTDSQNVLDSAQNYLNRLMPDAALQLLLAVADTVELSSDAGIKTRIAMAEAYRSKREYRKGFSILYEVLEENGISKYDKAHAFNRLAALYNESIPKAENHFDSVINYSKKCIDIAESEGFSDLLASSNNELGFVFKSRKKYLLSEQHLKTALDLYLENDYNQHAVGVAINLAGNYLAREMYSEANTIIDSAFTFVPKRGNENLWMRLYLQKAKTNEFKGNWKKAYYALSHGRILQKMYYNNKLDETIFEMSAKYEFDKQQLKLKEEERRSKARLREVFMLSVILIVTIVLFALSYRSSALKLKNKSQEEALQSLERKRLEEHLDYKHKELSSAIANAVAYNQAMNQVKSAISKNSPKEALDIINANINTQKSWQDFLLNFNEMYPHFFSKLIKTHPNLTETEQKLAAMLLMGLKSKEIAGVLNIALNSVNKGRNRLRKKLELNADTNMTAYFSQFI
jgi:DNA-binding NarL/FixJ family response regulator